MKKRMAAILLSMTLVFGTGTVFAAELPLRDGENKMVDMESRGVYEAAEDRVSPVGEPGAEGIVYTVTINFDANGGSGTGSQTVSSNVPSNLTADGFSRKDYTFTGWNTQKNGGGTAYAAGQDITGLATEANNGQTITLYAQWKINPPTITAMKSTKPGTLKISYKKIAEAKKYQLQYSTNKNFTKKSTKTVEIKDVKLSSVEIYDFVPNKTYYVRMSSYDGQAKEYGDFGNVSKQKTKNGKTLANTKCSTGIEADITLKGSGSGYHAKLVLVTPTSAVSYGIQFDKHAVAPYTNKAVTLIENVKSNAPGQQQYTRPSGKSLKVGKKYHMMLTIDSKGKGNVYLDYKKIGSFTNKNLANVPVYPRVEASVRLSGDKVNAVFDNIKLTRGGEVQEGLFGGQVTKSNKGIKTKREKNKNKVTISGKGIGIKGDWDSDYENASGIWSF